MLYNIIALLVLMLAGCAGVPINPSDMTAKQLEAWAQDKESEAGCFRAVVPGAATVTATRVRGDKGAVPRGTAVKIDAENCSIEVSMPTLSK